MNKAELLKKIEAMKLQNNTVAEETPTPKQVATPPTNGVKCKLKSFKVLWSEATSQYDNKEVTTWKAANDLMLSVGKCASMEVGKGYDKTKVEIVWENGYSITDRLDLSLNSGDFNPFKQTIQEYLKPNTSVMYSSNLQKGDRETLLSWEDETTLDQYKPQVSEIIETNLSETPKILKQLLGIVETIEESNDNSDTSLIKASEQVEKCKAYILYLKSILPILEAKTEALIEAKHKPQPIQVQVKGDYTLN